MHNFLFIIEGLGLKPPSKEFWKPVGTLTSAMTPNDKVNLLAHIIPRFGSGDAAQEEALEAFVSGLKPTFEVVQSKCPDMSKGDVQLLGTELLASEVLTPGRSSRKEFAVWLEALSAEDLEKMLSKRNEIQLDAEAAISKMQADRKAENERREAEIRVYREQIANARKERSMVFDEKTGKMVEVEK